MRSYVFTAKNAYQDWHLATRLNKHFLVVTWQPVRHERQSLIYPESDAENRQNRRSPVTVDVVMDSSQFL